VQFDLVFEAIPRGDEIHGPGSGTAAVDFWKKFSTRL